MFQDFMTFAIRAAGILTGAYVAGNVLGPTNGNPVMNNQLNILAALTIGSLTSADIRVEYSIDGTTWYQETFEDIAGGISTLSGGVYRMSATGNHIISIPVKAPYIRISAIGNGTVDGSSLKIDAVLGVV
jgi:hypothetical protein